MPVLRLLLILALLSPGPALAVLLGGDLDVSTRVEYLVDVEGKTNVPQVDKAHFAPLPKQILNPGYTSAVYWFRIRPQLEDVFLEVAYPLLDHVDLYRPDGQGGYIVELNGDNLAFSERILNHRHPLFKLKSGHAAPVYLRVQSSGPTVIPINLWRHDAFYDHLSIDEFVHGLYFGIMIIMVAYNLFLYFAVRDRNYLNYVFYIGVFVLAQVALNGYALQYLWPDSPWLANHAQAFLVGLVIFAGVRFTRDFLDLAHTLPAFVPALTVVQWAALGIMAFTLFGSYALAAQLANYLGLILVVVLLPAGILCAWRGYRPAYWFLSAWGLFLLGVFTTGLAIAGHIPYQAFSANSMQLGAALEVLLLSLALADRIAILRAEKEAAQAEANRHLLKLNENLETQVRERTQELTAANHALEEKNRDLADIARHDGLTGLLNHASFMSLLSAQVEEAQRYDYPLSLMMIDIDHFKRINDSHGHQFGDSALVAMANVLMQGKRASDEAARYGGEEFALILPHTDLDAAMRLAERLRHAVMAIRLDGADELVMSASFGVAKHTAGSDASPSDHLIQQADSALYRAKSQGRNQVCASP